MTKEKAQADIEIEALAEVFGIAKLVKGQYGGDKFAEKIKAAA